MIRKSVLRVGVLFASLRLTILTLLSLALAMSLGTIYESGYGTPAARVVYYRAWWFDGLLVLLTMNLVGCTYFRMPRLTTRWAYLLLHNSIILIFLGGLIGRWYGLEGQLVFAEGEEKSSIASEANVLRVTFKDGKEYVFPTESVDAFPHIRNPDHVFSLDDHGVRIRARRFFPDFAMEEGAVEGQASDPAGVQVQFSMRREKVSQWLFAPGDGSALTVAGLNVVLKTGAPDDKEQTSPPVGGMLELKDEARGLDEFVPVEGAVGQEKALGATGLKVTVLQTFRRFTMGAKAPRDAATGAENPAVIFKITGPGIDENRVAFALYPKFDQEHGKKSSGIQALYHFHAQHLVLYYKPQENRTWGRMVNLEEVTTGPMSQGVEYPVKAVPGLKVTILSRLPRARPAMVPVNKSSAVRRPALELGIENQAGEASLWLPFEETRRVAFGDSVATLQYTRLSIPLGFSLTLKKFEVGRYQGTQNPSSYQSQVALADKEAGLSADRLISMNEPLVHRGFTCYQSSYVEGERMTSVLSVAKDPGGRIAYVGFTGFMIGLICVITFRPNRSRVTAINPMA